MHLLFYTLLLGQTPVRAPHSFGVAKVYPSPATRSPFGTSGLLVGFNGVWFMPQRRGSFWVECLGDIFRCRFCIIYFIRSPCSSTIGAGAWIVA